MIALVAFTPLTLFLIPHHSLNKAGGYANGDRAQVHRRRHYDGFATSVRVKVDFTSEVYKISRSSSQRKFFMGKLYERRTFPLQLAYAITGHKSQGKPDLQGRCFAFVRDGFVPGLLYVILSRVNMYKQSNIFLFPRKPLTPDDFKPMPTGPTSGRISCDVNDYTVQGG